MKQDENERAWEIYTTVASHLSPEHTEIEIPGFVAEADKADWIKNKCKNMEHPMPEDADRKLIQQLKQEGKIVEGHFFRRVARHYAMQEYLEGIKDGVLSELFSTLHAFLGNGSYFPADEAVAQSLLEYAASYPCKFPYVKNEFEIRMMQSVQYLQAMGFSVHVEMGTICCPEKVQQDLFDRLETEIKEVGGMKVLAWVLNTFLEDYIPDLDRYLMGRTCSDKKRNEPINLLLQLAAKNLVAEGDKLEAEVAAEKTQVILRLAEAMLDIADIQGESEFEYSSMGIEEFPFYLHNEMIFDKFCVPTQYNRMFVLKSLDYLVKPWFPLAKTEYHYRDYYKVAECFLRFDGKGGILNQYELKKVTGLSWRRLRQILTDLSLPFKEVNYEFTSLDGRCNLFFKPIILYENGQYLYIDQRLSGIGFYHVACDLISRYHKTLSRDQGTQLENMLKDEMTLKGFWLAYGKYPGKEDFSEGECDLVLSGSRNVFLEIKKKDIAEEMAQLDDVTLLESLAFGMIRAQKQCFRHDAYLKANGEMVLGDKGVRLAYQADKFPSYKISVCYPEYSFLCNKMFSMNVLEVILQGKFMAVDAERQGQLDKLDAVCETIRESVATIYPDGAVEARQVSFYSLFCSMQQLIAAIWWCDTEDEFLRVLDEWVYTTDKTLDPYFTLIRTKYYMEHPDNTVHKSMLDFAKKSGRPIMIVQ